MEPAQVVPCEIAVNETFQTFRLLPSTGDRYDMLLFFKNAIPYIERILANQIESHGGCKWYMVLKVRLGKDVPTEQELELVEPYFRSTCSISFLPDTLQQQIIQGFQKILTSFEIYLKEGSGWFMQEVLYLEVRVAKYNPLAGSGRFFQLPSELKHKPLALVEFDCQEQDCFLYCILAALHPHLATKMNPPKSPFKSLLETLNARGIHLPMTLNQINKFEVQNKLSINVFGYENEVIFPLSISIHKQTKVVNLLLLTPDNCSEGHFFWIKDMSSLLCGQRADGKNKKYYCNFCLHGFQDKYNLERHEIYCRDFGAQRTTMPKQSKKHLYFSEIYKQHRVPFAIYADLECFNTPIDGCTPSPTKSYTQKMTKHEPNSFAYLVVSEYKEYSREVVLYRGPHAVDYFLDCLIAEVQWILSIISQNKPVCMTDSDWKVYSETEQCFICEKPLAGHMTCIDHDHINGRFRGRVHSHCNILYKLTGRVPIFMHNLTCYDGILLLGCTTKNLGKITCIPKTVDKYLSIKIGDNLVFLDSLAFLSNSLERLVDDLVSSAGYNIPLVCSVYPSEVIPLLLKKNPYPYMYVKDWSVFGEKHLPPPEAFYNEI
jgi:hypothetical protein